MTNKKMIEVLDDLLLVEISLGMVSPKYTAFTRQEALSKAIIALENRAIPPDLIAEEIWRMGER